MLKAKRLKFEEELNVPEVECLNGDGWIVPLCKAYGYKERCWHGEVGSVDIEPVEAEHKCIGMILATYAERDWWNVDDYHQCILVRQKNHGASRSRALLSKVSTIGTTRRLG
jgi:hypothetical protein